MESFEDLEGLFGCVVRNAAWWRNAARFAQARDKSRAWSFTLHLQGQHAYADKIGIARVFAHADPLLGASLFDLDPGLRCAQEEGLIAALELM